MLRAFMLAVPLLLVPVAAAHPSRSTAPPCAQSRTGESCEEQNRAQPPARPRHRRSPRRLRRRPARPVGSVVSNVAPGRLAARRGDRRPARLPRAAAGGGRDRGGGRTCRARRRRHQRDLAERDPPGCHRLVDGDRGRDRRGRRRVHDRHRRRHRRRRGDQGAQADVPPPADQPLCPGLGRQRRAARLGFAAAAAMLVRPRRRSAQTDPDNPTCPASPNWSNYREMRFTDAGGERPQRCCSPKA